MKSLILVHGDKGGVGKSFTAKILLDILYDPSEKYLGLLDCDFRNPDVSVVYEDKIPTGKFDLTQGEGWAGMVDWIQNVDCEIIVASLPAQVGKSADEFGGIFSEAMQSIGVSLNIVWLLDSGRDSVVLLSNCLKQGWPYKRFFVVRNTFLSREFDIWDSSSAKKSYFELPYAEDMTIPPLDPAIRDALVKRNLTFSEGFELPSEETGLNAFNSIRLKKFVADSRKSLGRIVKSVIEDISEKEGEAN